MVWGVGVICWFGFRFACMAVACGCNAALRCGGLRSVWVC